MVLPYTWPDTEQVGWWDANDVTTGGIGCGSIHHGEVDAAFLFGCLAQWFTNETCTPGSARGDILECLDPSTKPWSAPGTAPIFSPCGCGGGNPMGCRADRGDFSEKFGGCCGKTGCSGYAFGVPAENYIWPEAPVTDWQIGSSQEVAWFVAANHRGGYSYRLCPAPKQGMAALTEECFQQTPLQFEGQSQWVVLGDGERQEVEATRVVEGTHPPGSMWTKVPLESSLARGHVIDHVQVPSDLAPGDYVLSFRWDCEDTFQIWNMCSNIRIV